MIEKILLMVSTAILSFALSSCDIIDWKTAIKKTCDNSPDCYCIEPDCKDSSK